MTIVQSFAINKYKNRPGLAKKTNPVCSNDWPQLNFWGFQASRCWCNLIYFVQRHPNFEQPGGQGRSCQRPKILRRLDEVHEHADRSFGFPHWQSQGKSSKRLDFGLCVTISFHKSLCSRIRTLDLLIARRSVSLVHPTSFPQEFSDRDLRSANISQIWGILLLLVVMIISPLLVILAKNAISSIQVRCTLIENVTEQKNEAGVLMLALEP